MESDTPRTESMQGNRFVAHVPVLFARTLERELNAAKADLAQRTAERDEARRSACTFKARYMDSRIGFSPMTDDEANTEARKIAARMRWDCFDAKDGER